VRIILYAHNARLLISNRNDLGRHDEPLVSGQVRGIGFPQATWRWDVITVAERDKLRTFCTGVSANVYIRTRTMDTADSYAYFSAIMVWDVLEEERDSAHRLNLKINFVGLVPYTP
jgi:hypothetical protein